MNDSIEKKKTRDLLGKGQKELNSTYKEIMILWKR